MKKKMKNGLLLSTLLLVSTLSADELREEKNSFDDISTRTSITFAMDNDGNLNPSIFIPFYYGSENQFFSGLGYTSGTLNEVNSVNGFSDSKNSLVSNSNDLLINYISYSTSVFGLKTSIGVQSTFSKIENNEFGYIHDSSNLFSNGTDYYISFDNSIELDVQHHAIRADIELPIGTLFDSRLSASVSPYTSLAVKQSTIFKPLVNETGTSSSRTAQDVSYNVRCEFQVKTGAFFDIGFEASYDNTSYKYDLAQLKNDGSSFSFQTAQVDTTEVTTSYLVKALFKKEIIGGLNPSFGYGIENLDTKNNLTGTTTSTDKTIFRIGVERRF